MLTLRPTTTKAPATIERCYCVPNGKYRWLYVWATSATEARAIAILRALNSK